MELINQTESLNKESFEAALDYFKKQKKPESTIVEIVLDEEEIDDANSCNSDNFGSICDEGKTLDE